MFIYMTILLIVLLIVMFWVYAARYKRVPPNKALVVFGHKMPDGEDVRILTSGGMFVRPIIESYRWLDLETYDLDLRIRGARTGDGRSMEVEISARVQINPEPEILKQAAVMLLNKSTDEIKYIAEKSIEGHLKEGLSSLTLEQINADREMVAQGIMESAARDLENLGLRALSLTISDIREVSEMEEAEAEETVGGGTEKGDKAPDRQDNGKAGAQDSREVVEERLEKLWAAYRVLEKRLKETEEENERLRAELEKGLRRTT